MSKLETRLSLDNSGFLAKMVESGTVTEREGQRMQRALKYVSDQMKVMERATGAANEATVGLKEVSHEMEQVGFHTAAAKRELLVLGHELVSGNYKRFGASLLVLGERTGAAALLFSGLGLAAIGTVAALGAFAFAAAKGAEASAELQKSINFTGNFAGITEGQFNSLSKTIADKTVVSIGKAREALQALVATGEVGPRVIGPMAEAVIKYAKATGESEEKVAKEFAKMGDDVAKFAEEHNKSMNFLTLSEYEYIKKLQETGQQEKAEMEVLRLMNDHIATTTTFWDKLKKATGEAWDEMLGNGRAETIEDKLAKVNGKLFEMAAAEQARRKLPAFSSSPDSAQDVTQRTALKLERQTLLHDQLRKAEIASTKAYEDHVNKAGLASDKYFEKLDKEKKGTNQLKKELEELNQQVKARQDAGHSMSPAEIASDKALIVKRNTPHAGPGSNHLATAIQNRLNLYTEEIAKLKDQEEQYKKYGKLLDKSAVSTELAAISAGKYAKATYQQKAALLALAAEEDAHAKSLKETEETSKEEARVKAKAIADAASFAQRLKDQSAATDDYVERLKAEARYQGKSNIERQIAIKSLEIEKQRREDLKKATTQDQVKSANDAADENTKKAIAGMKEAKRITDDLDAATKTFGAGADRAFTKYGDEAANAGKYAENFVGGSMKRMEDALVKFAETGKLSFSDLFKFMADEFLRNQIKMMLAGGASGGGGDGFSGIFGAIAGLFGVPTTGLSTSQYGTSGFATGTNPNYGNEGLAHHAQGTAYVPYDGPAFLHAGERVVTAADNAKGGFGKSNVFDFSGHVYNIGQGVSRGEVVAAVQSGNAQTEQRIRRLMRNGNIGS